jgi:hypothetical protein
MDWKDDAPHGGFPATWQQVTDLARQIEGSREMIRELRRDPLNHRTR